MGGPRTTSPHTHAHTQQTIHHWYTHTRVTLFFFRDSLRILFFTFPLHFHTERHTHTRTKTIDYNRACTSTTPHTPVLSIRLCVWVVWVVRIGVSSGSTLAVLVARLSLVHRRTFFFFLAHTLVCTGCKIEEQTRAHAHTRTQPHCTCTERWRGSMY